MANILVILSAVVIAMLIGEIACRVYAKFKPSFIFPSSSYNNFRRRPFSKNYQIRLNSKGFNDIERAVDKKEHIFRIIGIGDSFTFGVVPYANNFLTLLEQKLNQKKERFEVINMGIPHAGVISYSALLASEALFFDPDLVICCFFMGDDFENEDRPRPSSRSYLCLFLKKIFRVYPEYEVYDPGDKYEDDLPFMKDEVFLGIERSRSPIFLKNNNDFFPKLDRSVLYLKRMKDICSLHRIRFLVVIIPDNSQVDINLQEKVINSFESLNKKDFDFELPNKLLRARLEKLDIKYIDLFNDFIVLSKNKKYYKPNDTHWNIAGNELAADLIFDNIKGLGK